MIAPVNTGTDDDQDASEALVGTVQAGRYRVEKLLGSGGMGAVYRAEHVHMRKAVALKVLHREMTLLPEVVARFEREAVAASRIEHPNVASATDFGRLEDGSFYLVLEYVEGQSLNQLLKRHRPLPKERALRIVRQIADALAAAHAAGIVHRDLKPDNIMLVHKDGHGDLVKVLDFGIAKVKVEDTGDQPALTQLGTVFGTPEYMSPEQARGDHVDSRSDLYTLGVMLYEMLAGASPFKDPDVVVVLTRHLTADPPPLPEHIDQDTAELTLRLLRKDPAQRVQTARELVERIDGILQGLPPKSWVLGAQESAPPGSVAVASAASAMQASEQYAPTLLNAGAPERAIPAGPTAISAELPKSSSPTSKIVVFTSRALSTIRTWGPSVHIAGRRFSAGTLMAMGGALIVIGLVGTLVLSEDSDSNQRAAELKELSKPEDEEVRELVAKAETGDVKAIAELSARPEAGRSAMEWRAVGIGYGKVGQLNTAIQTYTAGIKQHPALASDKAVIADVRRAADDKDSAEDALRLAAEHLGETGLNLIYDVWDSSKSKTQQAAITKLAKSYLDDEALQKKAPPALQVLLELPKVQKEGCSAVKKLLPRVVEHGDERALPLLKRFNERRGCGFLGLADCYSCLRSGTDLATALKSVEARPAPDFRVTAPITGRNSAVP